MLEGIGRTGISPSFSGATSMDLCLMASTGRVAQNEAARVAIPDHIDDPKRVPGFRPRPVLKIVFVDSSPHRRSTRLRRIPKHLTGQSYSVSCDSEYESFEDDTEVLDHSIRNEADEDESDEEYDDEELRSTKRTRAGRVLPQRRKQNRHGKLVAADRDLLREAEQGGPPQKPPKKKAPRIAVADAIDLVASMAEKIDWRQAVAIQHELQTMKKQRLAKSKEMKSGMQSGSSSMNEDTALADIQLKQYWSEVLVSSVLEMKTK